MSDLVKAPGAFDLASTAKALHQTLGDAFATVPDGRSHVVIVDGTTQNGGQARILYAQKAAKGWDVILEGSIDKPHGLGARVATMKSW